LPAGSLIVKKKLRQSYGAIARVLPFPVLGLSEQESVEIPGMTRVLTDYNLHLVRVRSFLIRPETFMNLKRGGTSGQG
jgi:hypothetical protein